MNHPAQLIPEPEAAELERPCYQVYDRAIQNGDRMLRRGVWYHGFRKEKGEQIPLDTWVCDPLHVDAITRNETRDGNYGRLLRFMNADHRWLTWAMPMHSLAGTVDGVIGELLAMGLHINNTKRHLVANYISEARPTRTVIATTSTGWHGSQLFITPGRNIGTGDAIYQNESKVDGDYAHAGTLQDWQRGIAAMLPGNPLLQLGIGTALAGTLLQPLKHQSSGGFHLQADSSNGKTTIVNCASSVWGHGTNFTLKWNATSNGMEGIACLRCDTLLALDELGEANGQEAGNVVYSLTDGIGKQRAARTGTAKRTARWRVMLLSSGEISLETKMREAGKQIRAGQEVRLVNVSSHRQFGAWDNLHSHPDGASLADALKQTSVTHYGHAGPEFVRQLIDGNLLPSLSQRLERIQHQFPHTTGQAARVAERFALVALALELASEMRLLPLAADEGCHSMLALYKEWLQHHGTGPSEDRQILQAALDFIEKHGHSRFASLRGNKGELPIMRDLAGYWEEHPIHGRLYLFTSGGLREAIPGFERGRVIKALQTAGAIARKDSGRNQTTSTLPDSTKAKLYCINPAQLQEA